MTNLASPAVCFITLFAYNFFPCSLHVFTFSSVFFNRPHAKGIQAWRVCVRVRRRARGRRHRQVHALESWTFFEGPHVPPGSRQVPELQRLRRRRYLCQYCKSLLAFSIME